jgi:hypothetical protein
VLGAVKHLGEHVFAVATLEREAESIGVEGTGCLGVPDDRGDARQEQDLDRLPSG